MSCRSVLTTSPSWHTPGLNGSYLIETGGLVVICRQYETLKTIIICENSLDNNYKSANSFGLMKITVMGKNEN